MFSKFSNSLQGAQSIIKTLEDIPKWSEGVSLLQAFDVEPDYSFHDVNYITKCLNDIALHTEQTESLILKWNASPDKVFALALCCQLLDGFGFDDVEDQALCQRVFVAAALADCPNDNFYHNNLHFKKVVLHTARMIAAHNYIFENGLNSFSKDQIALLLVCACIHDLGHNGQGNIIERKYNMAATEIKSFEYALPYLEATHLDADSMKNLRYIIFCTDASPFGDPISPSQQLRRAYEYHFGDEDGGDLELSSELSVLEENETLCLMAMVIHEADLMNSIGVSYEITVEESIAVSKEIKTEATPEGVLLFFEKTCENDLYTDCGRYLGQKNFDLIRSKVLEDYNKGNDRYCC